MPRCVFEDRAHVNLKSTNQVRAAQRPGRLHAFRAFLFFGVTTMKLSRDWWAVVVAALAVLLVKLGLVAGVPW
jgi:hypothetical protein